MFFLLLTGLMISLVVGTTLILNGNMLYGVVSIGIGTIILLIIVLYYGKKKNRRKKFDCMPDCTPDCDCGPDLDCDCGPDCN